MKTLFTKILRRLLVLETALMLVSGPVMAEGRARFSTTEELTDASRGNEFVSGTFPGAVLMQVNLWGAVGKAGIYHVPTQTDLLTLLSYAGGPTKEAKLDEVKIKRRTKGQEQIINLSLRDSFERHEANGIVLEPNDIIMLETKEEAISTNTLKTVTFISAILGIVISGIIISDRFTNHTPATQR